METNLKNHKVISINKNEDISEIINKIKSIEEELNNMYFERKDVIKNMLVSTIAKQNMFLIGLPGTAKSELINEFSSRIEGCKYFSWLFNKTSDPSEIFGTFSIKQMENDKFIRITKGKMPEAHIVFCDEIYKANEPILNALLTLMNERVFYNDGLPVKTPTISIFGASNEEPDSENLSALHDRFAIKMNVEYIKDSNKKLQMLKSCNLADTEKTTITLEDLYTLQEHVNSIEISDEILYQLILITNKLSSMDIIVSDRKLKQSVKILKANALVNQKVSVTESEFDILTYVYSDGINNVEEVRKVIQSYNKDFNKEFKNIKNEFEQMRSSFQFNITPETTLNLKLDLGRLVNKADELLKFAENKNQQNKLVTLIGDINNYSKQTIQKLLDV
jgi:MoxR-like ATPase